MALPSLDLRPLKQLPPGPVIPAAVIEACAQARHIEEDARQAAEQIKRQAEVDAAQCLEASRPKGIAEGLALLADATAKLHDERKALAGQLRPILQQCLEHVLGTIPVEMRVPAILQNVLQDYEDELDIRLMVHPDNRAAFETAVNSFVATRPARTAIRVTAEPYMSTTDCLVYAGPDVIDIAVPTIAQEMIAALTLEATPANKTATRGKR
ncbi:HrpE/YscL family type III secretion apparatus protein [Martelella sp. HB161492]|uniref:HrpE/YscL family type III secretion apparatus protein n=1 Tax=Martelella sp. HB161492 TaxID=2720726 RepID=UPI00159189AC|nr:HrpE/YscL family type III secretion apparatus protein [Martelella sp. HB161492]